MSSGSQKDLLSSVISEIKSYNGDDPLRPWVRGIRKIHQSLPPHVLSEKLPRFLQKCAQTFESDRRYRNDSRYLAVWIQLMDYVEDAGVILRKMEKTQIGVKRAKFYTAYALYYEKKKRFEDAEKMYQLGVKKLAEPMVELQKSYEQFIHRMKLLKHRRARREAMANNGETTTGDPKISTKEAMDVISYMFKEAQLPETISRTVNQVKQKPNLRGNIIQVFVDKEMEASGDGIHSIISNNRPVFAEHGNSDSPQNNDNSELQKPFVGAFKILGDEEDDDDGDDDNVHGDCKEIEEPMEGSCQHARPDIRLKEDTVFRRLKDDTVIRKIVGSEVFDEPKVENACHHGLVDPTVNLKQAIYDINGMFGKTLNFAKVRKTKKQEKLSNRKPDGGGKHAFFILADDNMEKDLYGGAPPCISRSSNGEIGLFEPTLFTKEAMNEINDLFGKPLDF